MSTTTTNPIKVAIVLNEIEDQKTDTRFLISYHGYQRKKRMKPTRSFRNWTKYFKIPYFCFIDIAVFSLYLIFAVFHENSSITFSVDLENAIHSFINNDMLDSYNELSNSNQKVIYSNNKKIDFSESKEINQNTQKNLKSRDLHIIDPPKGIPLGEGQIFLLDDFIYLLDESTNKLFQFSTRFPMSHPILDYGYVTMTIKLLNGTVIEHIIKSDRENNNKIHDSQTIFTKQVDFNENADKNEFEFTEKSFLNNKVRIKTKVKTNKNDKLNQNNFEKKNIKFDQNNVKSSSFPTNIKPSDYVIPYLMDFQKVSVSMSYHLQITGRISDSMINLEIISDFERDIRTDTIIYDIYHTRFQEKIASLLKVGTALYTFNYSLPIVILLLNIFAIFRLIKEAIYDLFAYSKQKSDEVGQLPSFIFSKKFDKWAIYAIFTHFTSIVAMVLYIFIGQNIGQKVPPINIFLSSAAFNHCILLIRYLNLKDTTFLVITVLYKSSLILLKFLLGCLPFFFAFWAFGICFFGHLSFIFASPLQCASYMFCVMHGDSILAFFDNTIIQNDYSWELGFFYSALWVMFSLLLVFNITISIFQDVLRQENAKLVEKNNDEQQNHHTTPLHLDFLTNNIRLMMNSNQYKNPNPFPEEPPSI